MIFNPLNTEPMKTFRCVTLSVLTLLFAACTADRSPECDAAPGSATRAYGDKTPKILVLIETNDVNPLNAKSYRLGTSSGKAFIDVVQLWAATIHKNNADGYPSLYFNDRIAPLFKKRDTYIKPLQDAGIKVLLTIAGDWQGIGVGNMTEAQADRFADLLVHAVDVYGLDGLDFDDEYANYPSLIDGSYGRVIRALRTKLDAKFGTGSDRKLITVFAYGTTSQIDAAAGAGIDFAYPPVSATNTFTPTTPIPGVTKDRWCPITINLSQRNPTILNLVRTNAAKANSQGYGGIACVGLRRASDVDPLPTFNAIAQGAYNSTVFYDGNDYAQDWTPDPSGLTITVDDIP